MSFERLVRAALSPDPAEAEAASRALFRDFVEPWADAFDPAACAEYVARFAPVIERAVPGLRAERLAERYAAVRQPRQFDAPDPAEVTVLSRVTLGADAAIASVLIDAAKKRFPEARIHFAGPRKNYELFAADPRVHHLDAPYARTGLLRDRIAAGLELGRILSAMGCVVIDPDSRLTQLGLLPVCPDDAYFFWEGRTYGGDSGETLGGLVRRWARQTFGVADAAAYIAPAADPPDPGGDLVTVSFGVGENPDKRVADPFEPELVKALAATGLRVLIDEGAGGEEAERVRRAAARAANVTTFRGPFAAFAASIARSRLYVGYDSAGQHAAAACGVPLVAVFAGFPNERMFSRWRPSGAGPVEVIRAGDGTLDRTVRAVRRLLGETRP